MRTAPLNLNAPVTRTEQHQLLLTSRQRSPGLVEGYSELALQRLEDAEREAGAPLHDGGERRDGSVEDGLAGIRNDQVRVDLGPV